MEGIIVFVTASKEEEAVAIARVLVEERLAGCVNIVGGVRSIYRWEGNLEDDREVLMIVKTRRELFPLLEKRVKELHSYTVPEIIALPVAEGSLDYLAWLEGVVG
jgi:periplasmic divalent cation tolerance protein